jgi:pimeloyl-ACP methyl ester carboxylesterase
MNTRLQRASRFAHLCYWLGPWAPKGRLPSGVSRRPLVDAFGEAGGWLYTPVSKPITDAWLLSPGAHPHGPDDPRIHRLATVLAAAGYAVLSPAIPDLMRMQLRRRAVHDLTRAFDTLVAQPDIPFGVRPGVLAMSLGSLAALRLAASRPYRTRISRVVTVGAYADPRQLMRALTGALHRDNPRQPWDPRSQPLAFLTLLDHLPWRPGDPVAIGQGWRRYLRAAWPRRDMGALVSPARLDLARRIGGDIDARDRELFLVGCGARPGGAELIEAALDSCGAPYRYLDPRAVLDRIHAPLHLIHGVLDPLIPFSQLASLKALAPRARAYPIDSYQLGALAGALRAVC